MSDYDTLRRQCRTLESVVDTKLTAYSRLTAGIGRQNADDVEASGSTDRWADLESELDGALAKLAGINEELSSVLNNPNVPPSQSMIRAVQRHRELLADYTTELKRSKTNTRAALDRANLLRGVRNDIDSYKSSTTDALLAERGRIDSSHRMTDDILAQAYATRDDFARQRATLSGIGTRMTEVASRLPGINNLVSMIKSRRRRDAIIIGVVIGLCMLFLFSYVLR